MQTGHIKVMTAKVRQFIEINEEEALSGTIKFGRSALELEETGGRFVRKPNFAIPGPCSERPISADGRVAFHFKHTFVVKKARYAGSTALKSAILVVSGDSESFSTDAADHERYISREAAVMAIGAASYDQYIEAGGLANGTAAIFTNIHPDLERRVEYWNAITRCERNPSPDLVKLHLARLSAEQWETLLASHEPDTPIGELAQQYTSEAAAASPAANTIVCQLEFLEFRKLRKQLKDMGAWDKKNPPITIKRGRGGRVQRRMVAEFPTGVDAAARIRIAANYVEWLGARGMMYTGVIHAPDHHNDDRNFHFHIAAHDRPCRYLEEHGCWDVEYREPVPGQHKRFRYPMRQKKVADLTRPSEGRQFREHGAAVLTQMREKFADLCNEELKKLGVNRLFDHRSYVAMGIQQKPGRHLGTKAASLEAAGVPTTVGIENAERSWQGAFDRAVKDHEVRQQLRFDCRRHSREALDRLLKSRLASPLIGELDILITDYDQLESAVGEQERDLALLYLTLQMSYSRCDKTADVCQRLVEAIENGNASAAERDSEDEIRERLRLAEEHQDRIFDATHDEIKRAGELAKNLAPQVKKLDEVMKAMREAIDQAEELLLPRGRAEPTVDVHRGDLPSADVRSRYSRELAAYFEAPLDYEEEWDRVFMRVQYEGLEIKAPTAQVPHYHVPRIAKLDLDRLMNPIFEKRSQARLQAMYKFQELNRSREAERAAARAAAEPSRLQAETTASSVQPELRRPPELERAPSDNTAVHREIAPPEMAFDQRALDPVRDEHFEQLQRQAAEQRNKDQADAIGEWIAWFRSEYEGLPLPARFEDGKLILEVEKLPIDRRQIADVFSDEVTELVVRELDDAREVLRNVLLGASRELVHIKDNHAVYEPRDFVPEVQHHLELLLQGDPVVRGYIEQAPSVIAQRQASESAAAGQAPTNAAGPSQNRPAIASVAGVVEQAWHLAQKGKSR